MRDLVILRGAPGAGKTTFLNETGLSSYAISVDQLRLLFQSPIMDHEIGHLKTTQKHDNSVWILLFKLLEDRMTRGELTVIDACHSKSSDFTKYYKLAEKYRYRLWCIDFSDVPIDICKKQNMLRPIHLQVPDCVIDNMYARFSVTPIPNKVIKVNKNNWKQIIEYNPLDVSEYKKLVFIGDVHGCFDPLNKYFMDKPFNDNTLYVFLGDYFDRGIQNAEVCEWLLNYYNKPNVMLLTGNHEKCFINYVNNEYESDIRSNSPILCRSNEFFYNTLPALQKFDLKQLRQLSRKLIQCAYLKFGEDKFICTHAGLGFMPEKLKFIASTEFIRGGSYEEQTDKWFEKNNIDPHLYQVHGHRNSYELNVNEYPHSLNLNSPVEFGESLRIVEITK